MKEAGYSILDVATPAFLSPEFENNDPVESFNERSMIYTLGKLLSETLGKIDELDNHLQGLFNECTHPDPQNRPQSLMVVINELTSIRDWLVSTPHDSDDHKAIEILMEDAWNSFGEKDLYSATTKCRQTLAMCPDHREALRLQDLLESEIAEVDQIYSGIDCDLDSADLRSLIDRMEEAINRFPNHPTRERVERLLSERIAAFQRCAEAGARSVAIGDWTSAAHNFTEAARNNPGNQEVQTSAQIYSELTQIVDSWQRKIDQSIRNGEFEVARNLEMSLVVTLRRYGFGHSGLTINGDSEP